MRILAKTCVILAACLVATQQVQAVDWSKPFVSIAVPQMPVNLGVAIGSGLQEFKANLTARVVANCPYQVLVSFDGLQNQVRNVAISPKDMTVAINGKQVPIGKQRVPIASGGPTPRGGEKVAVDLQVGVNGSVSYPAGTYCGSLVITVTAGH